MKTISEMIEGSQKIVAQLTEGAATNVGVAGLQDLLKTVTQMTDENDHNAARLEIAKYYNLKDIVKIFEAIQTIHYTMRHMTPTLINFRNETTNNMFIALKDKIENDELKALKNAL